MTHQESISFLILQAPLNLDINMRTNAWPEYETLTAKKRSSPNDESGGARDDLYKEQKCRHPSYEQQP